MNKSLLGVLVAFLAASGIRAQQTPAAVPVRSCDGLRQLAISGARIVSAQRVAAGEFTPPSSGAQNEPGADPFAKNLPAFCRVQAKATPTAASDIRIEVWLPEDGWNGKLRSQGNGGFAGEIIYRALESAVVQGYATAGTDTGHSGAVTDARWALGHPEKVADFGYRGIHEMTRVAKEVIWAYYGSGPQHSYIGSCSNGGRQALMEAQRYPEDYDGILAGAPANYWTHLLTNAIWNAQALTTEEGSYIPSSKIPALAHAVNAACDALDGVKDGVLADPRKCRFDPATMLCKSGDSNDCLTAPQITTLKKLYSGAHDAHGHPVFPGYLPGAEDGPGGWSLWITGAGPGRGLLFAFGNGFFSNMVYKKADWTYKGANLGNALKAADEKAARVMNATNPNLSRFRARGGKLILYHGWNDPAISALNTIDYYEGVVKKMGGRATQDFVQLYLLPGVQHCGGGAGPSSFGAGAELPAGDSAHSAFPALEQWVEKGTAPTFLIAKPAPEDQNSVKMTRPICPYPQIAKYKGTGDTNDAANFACAANDP
jgi:hypothetical protein